MINILIEAVAVGLSTLFIGFVLQKLPIAQTQKIPFLLFLTGFATHIVYEVVGANDKYCEYRVFSDLVRT